MKWFFLNFLFCFSIFAQLGQNHFDNELIIYIIRPKYKISWKSPSHLGATSFFNTFGDDYAPIGHFAVEVRCQEKNSFGVRHILTGMERVDKKESKRITMEKKLGLGSLFYNFAGDIQSALTTHHEIEQARTDERLKTVKIPISGASCQKMLEFTRRWISHGSYTVYGGNKKVSLGEGSGCADFALEYFSIATGIELPPELFVKVKVPMSLIGDGKKRKVSFVDIGARFSWAKEGERFRHYQTPDTNKTMEFIAGKGQSLEDHYIYTRHLTGMTEKYGIWTTDLPQIFKDVLNQKAEELSPHEKRPLKDFSYCYELRESEEETWQRIDAETLGLDCEEN